MRDLTNAAENPRTRYTICVNTAVIHEYVCAVMNNYDNN